MPVNPDVITQPQPDRIRTRLARLKIPRFHRFRSGQQTPREVLTQEKAVFDARLETAEPPQAPDVVLPKEEANELGYPIDPEAEYQKAVDEVVNDETKRFSFQGLREQIDQKKAEQELIPAKQERQFTALDKARHQRLTGEAKRLGMEDTDAFDKLVTYVEKEFADTQLVKKEYKNTTSAQNQEKISNEWIQKGWDAYFMKYTDGKMMFYRTKDTPYNIEMKSVPVLKMLVEAGKDVPKFL